MSLDNALQTAVSSIPECLAAGYIDLSSGMILGWSLLFTPVG